MDISLKLPDGTDISKAELGGPHIDVVSMMLTIPVNLFNQSGDLVFMVDVDYQLTTFPILTPQEQWGVVEPFLRENFGPDKLLTD